MSNPFIENRIFNFLIYTRELYLINGNITLNGDNSRWLLTKTAGTRVINIQSHSKLTRCQQRVVNDVIHELDRSDYT